ncbi:MAG: type II and III secretion system protein family protein [Syntrophobacteraceae bacterium]
MCSRFGPRIGKIKLFLAAFALVLVFYAGCRGAGVEVISVKGKKVNLEVGKSVIIRSEVPIVRVSSANPEVATVTALSPTQIYVTGGKTPGVTNITLWKTDDKIAAVYDVEVAPDVSSIKEKIQRLFPEEKGLQVIATHDSLTLAGTVSSTAVLSQALALAEAYGGPEKKVINVVRVSGVQQVMLEVRVAEMQKTLTKQLSINFSTLAGSSFGMGLLGSPGSIVNPVNSLSPAGTLVPATATAAASITSPLTQNLAPATNALFHISGHPSVTAFLDALKQDGLVKVLAEPTLLALSGQTATFKAGGSFPVPVPQGLGTVGIQYTDYGVILAFTPTVLDDNRISMKVEPTVSELDYSNAVTIQGTTVPALTSRGVSTVIQLGDGQSFAIAGLLQDNISETIGKYPYLGDVPVLGTLFRSSQFQRNETELIIIATPHLVKPIDLKKQPLPTDKYVEPSDKDFFLRGLLQGCQKASPPPVCQESQAGLEGDFGHALPK